jgi:putative salt-induced outer membrane protein
MIDRVVSRASRPTGPVAVALAVAAALLSLPAQAAWTGKGQAGLVIASGNSESKSGSVKLGVSDVEGPWAHKLGFAAVYAADAVTTTAQRWEVLEQTNYSYNMVHDFVFGGLRYEDDRYSGFNYQATLSAGLGHQFFETPTTNLSAQLGLGYKVADSRLPPQRITSLASLGSVDLRHAFNAATTLLDKLTVEYTSSNTYFQNETTLEVKMSAKLALAVAYVVRHNSDPPPGFRNTDTLTTVNVVYEIK